MKLKHRVNGEDLSPVLFCTLGDAFRAQRDCLYRGEGAQQQLL